MSSKKYDIFISYRRTDGKDIARALKESLAARGYNVFLDYDALQDGVFDRRILDAIDSAPIYILLLTEHCLDRCVNETDWVRLELEHALSHGKQIVPLVPDKQFNSFPDNVPEFIRKGLGQHQYSALDTGQLYLASIEQLDEQRLRPVLRKRVHKKVATAVAAILLVLSICGSIFLWHWNRMPQLYFDRGMAYAQIGESGYCLDSAIYWLNLAAEDGHPAAQRELGNLYRFTSSAPGHEDWAFYWLQKAYLSSDVQAIALLGACYEEGLGIPIDLAEAISLYREGVDAGDGYAMFRLGKCLCDGVGLRKDYVEGMRYIVEAAACGDEWAHNELGDEVHWIFSPHADSVRSKSAVLRAIALTDSTTTVFLRWNNQQYFGGWMQIDPSAYIRDVQSGETYHIQSLIDCRFSPDTTSVPFGTYHDFAWVFPALSDSSVLIDICESDTSRWKWMRVRIK